MSALELKHSCQYDGVSYASGALPMVCHLQCAAFRVLFCVANCLIFNITTQHHVLRQQQHPLAAPAPSKRQAETRWAFGLVESRWNAIAGLATGFEAILFGPGPQESQGGSPALSRSQPHRHRQGQPCRHLVLHAAQGGHCWYGIASAQG